MNPYKKYWYLFLILIISVGLYLRFFNIESIQEFGWDQARDAWKVRDILNGKIVLNGPRTGVGHMELGPLWFYLLAPFYFITNLDPSGANFLNFFVNIFNFAAIFYVSKKIFNVNAALFITLFYSLDKYLIQINRVSWNVSPVPGVSIILFYAIYKVIHQKKYKWVFLIAFLVGLFSHLHFSFVFLPFIVLFSFLMAKNIFKVVFYSLMSLPLFFIWFIPIIIYDWQTKSSNLNHLNEFFKYYIIKGFHLKFFLYRLYDAFIQFETVLSLPKINRFLVLVIPLLYLAFLVFETDKKQKILGYLIMLWFFVPSLIYSFYGGTTSEYYMLMTSVFVIYIVWYFIKKIIDLKIKLLNYFLILSLIIFFYLQTKDEWIKLEKNKSLKYQKLYVKQMIKENNKIEFNEGDIHSYLWHIWVEDKR